MTVPYRANQPGVPVPEKIQKRAPAGFDDRGVEAAVPLVDVALHEDDLRFGIHIHEIACEGHGGRVSRDGAKGAEERVPLGAGEGGALAEEFGVLRGVPGAAVGDVGEPFDGVVAFQAEDVEGDLHCWDAWALSDGLVGGRGQDAHIVPVRGKERLRTSMGTTRSPCRRLSFLSGVKNSG